MQINKKNKITAIGVMSGTSMDGLDIAKCEFWFDTKWNFNILNAKTYNYSEKIFKKLKNATKYNGEELLKFNNEYGNYIGKKIDDFLKNDKVDLIASHGHTIFHQPENNFTFQIGNGANIAATTQITTISDFRIFDVAEKGQGAPLVPIGDKELFPEYKYCLNIGGFANISIKENNKIYAFDICPANIILNYISENLGKKFDKDGKIGRYGNANNKLINELDNIKYYYQPSPKSLGREWFENVFIKIINKYNLPAEDKIASVYEHITNQISKVISEDNSKILITGGGAKNKFLTEVLKKKIKKTEIIIPSEKLIDYKEALIFAFLGVLRLNERINVLSEVTGAKKNTISGVIFKI